MNRSLSVLTVVGAALVSMNTIGCITNLPSPPANPMPLEAPRTLDEGRTSISATGTAAGMFFGQNVAVGTVTVSRGMTEGVEANVSATAMSISQDSGSHWNPLVGAAHVGTKIELGTHHVALTAGLGGGTWAAGGFVSPDIGFIVGYDNPYLIPFAALRGGLSAPVGPNDVDVSANGEAPGTHVVSPRLTEMVSGTAGLRLPIGDQRKGVAGALSVGMSWMNLYTQGDGQSFLGVGAAGEVSFLVRSLRVRV